MKCYPLSLPPELAHAESQRVGWDVVGTIAGGSTKPVPSDGGTGLCSVSPNEVTLGRLLLHLPPAHVVRSSAIRTYIAASAARSTSHSSSSAWFPCW